MMFTVKRLRTHEDDDDDDESGGEQNYYNEWYVGILSVNQRCREIYRNVNLTVEDAYSSACFLSKGFASASAPNFNPYTTRD